MRVLSWRPLGTRDSESRDHAFNRSSRLYSLHSFSHFHIPTKPRCLHQPIPTKEPTNLLAGWLPACLVRQAAQTAILAQVTEDFQVEVGPPHSFLSKGKASNSGQNPSRWYFAALPRNRLLPIDSRSGQGVAIILSISPLLFQLFFPRVSFRHSSNTQTWTSNFGFQSVTNSSLEFASVTPN